MGEENKTQAKAAQAANKATIKGGRRAGPPAKSTKQQKDAQAPPDNLLLKTGAEVEANSLVEKLLMAPSGTEKIKTDTSKATPATYMPEPKSIKQKVPKVNKSKRTHGNITQPKRGPDF